MMLKGSPTMETSSITLKEGMETPTTKLKLTKTVNGAKESEDYIPVPPPRLDSGTAIVATISILNQRTNQKHQLGIVIEVSIASME
jgi:hypothetical protein